MLINLIFHFNGYLKKNFIDLRVNLFTPFFLLLNILCPKETDFCEKLNLELSFIKPCKDDKTVIHMDFLFK